MSRTAAKTAAGAVERKVPVREFIVYGFQGQETVFVVAQALELVVEGQEQDAAPQGEMPADAGLVPDGDGAQVATVAERDELLEAEIGAQPIAQIGIGLAEENPEHLHAELERLDVE